MVKSPKSGRELGPSRVYLGPKWLVHLVHGKPDDEVNRDENNTSDECYSNTTGSSTVTSPKSGRELGPSRVYLGPKWLTHLVHGKPDDEPDEEP